ncbi:MAG: hypothetical protein WDO14_09875 [Bacteroidota bacterium]
MEQSIFDIMWRNTPTITVFILAAIMSGFIVYKCMRFVIRFEKTEAAVSDLQVRMTKVEGRLDKVEERLNNIETRLAVVETKLDMVIEKVDNLAGKLDRLIEAHLIKNSV